MNFTTPSPSPTTASACAVDILSKQKSAQYFIIPSGIIGALTMALNLLVVVAVAKNKKLHKPAFYYVSSLAVADFIAGFMIAYAFFRGFFTGTTTRLELELKQAVFILSVSASILTLLVISLNRYFVIVHPFHYRSTMNNAIVVIAIVITWIYPIVGGFLPLAGWNDANYECSGIIPGLAKSYVFVLSLHVVVILIVILVLYLRIYCKVRESANSFVVGGRSAERKAHIKVAKTLFIVTTAFAVCWLPYMTICILDFAHSIKLEKYTPVFAVLAALNSGLNPLIYAWRDGEMRTTFKSILCPSACCNRPPAHDSGMESSNASTHSTLFTMCYGGSPVGDGAEGRYEDIDENKNPPKDDKLERRPLTGD
ncbi:lysophosphatidic acid receptor 1-A-like [Actinia tenebrosa]|uniref:Lysophosphatidic acid receptor 1-A-like n=1 Tax=Actinia tenebrosa TaxID=6105 RepID=A0A6P8HHZ3_ACTTE|nr:lysophosphatidic acid receptor 1-A-like [Actinia tenebrosa]